MVMPNNARVLFLSCLWIYASQSNAFDTVSPRKKHIHWRRGRDILAHDNYDDAVKHQFYRLDQSCIMAIRCGSDAEDDGDNRKMATSINNKRTTTSPTTAIATWYMNQLDTHELRTKFISAAILALVGDVCAQTVGNIMINRSSSSGANIPLRLDKRRMMAMFADGLLCAGPLLHHIYNFYERIIPTHHDDEGDKYSTSKRRFLAPLAHVLLDNFVVIVVYIFALMVSTGLIEGRYASLPHELRHDLLPAVRMSYKASVAGLAPLQWVSFCFLPLKLRVLAVNVLDVVWVTVMSFVTHRNRH
mmetsp:Transcript_12277/g.26420  ORF Transcript_12277/g.26420 Transcript_12277/m.26420 type:complete len:302 (-) Transcript_12277:409-1314(-)